MSEGLSPAHEALQDGALPCALLAHHGDLRQLEAAALPRAAQGVLQAVDQRNQVLHPSVAHHCGAAGATCPASPLRTSAVRKTSLQVLTILSWHPPPTTFKSDQPPPFQTWRYLTVVVNIEWQRLFRY